MSPTSTTFTTTTPTLSPDLHCNVNTPKQHCDPHSKILSWQLQTCLAQDTWQNSLSLSIPMTPPFSYSIASLPTHTKPQPQPQPQPQHMFSGSVRPSFLEDTVNSMAESMEEDARTVFDAIDNSEEENRQDTLLFVKQIPVQYRRDSLLSNLLAKQKILAPLLLSKSTALVSVSDKCSSSPLVQNSTYGRISSLDYLKKQHTTMPTELCSFVLHFHSRAETEYHPVGERRHHSFDTHYGFFLDKLIAAVWP
ncbi:hypothetical protein BDF14DRAFT_1881244 [Spinellus fusiger]|nr:hypothetical protein BDF14DRAFT_1881244 [Spinellus fusiger]